MQVLGVGTDLVDVDRLRNVISRTPGIVDRVFTGAERADAGRRRDPTERYAARFAAKEAVMKALGTGMFTFPFREVEVVTAPDGAPRIDLHGRAAAVARQAGVVDLQVSLTHTGQVAHAIVLAVGGAPESVA